MYIYIYYPFQNKQYFTVAIDINFNIYWQASQFIRVFNLNKNVKKVLYKHLSKNERFRRFKDITQIGNCNNYALTTDQVLRLIDSIRPNYQNGNFEAWFHSVVEGRQMLYPKNPKEYVRLTKNPFQQRGFSALCVDDGPSTSPTTVISGPEESLSKEESVVNVEGSDEATFQNPPSCSSIYSEVVHSPPDPKKSIDQEFLFTLPVYVRHLKSTFGLRNASSMFPGMQKNNEEPPEFFASAEPAAPKEQDKSDSYPLDVDETKSFVYTDPVFKKEYKFHALKLNYTSGLRPMTVNPFYLSDENNVMYLYFPVKKE